MRILICLVVCFCATSLWGEEKSQFEKKTGLKGTYNDSEKVFKASFPRTDIKVSVNGLSLDPFMGLTSWVAFSPMENDHFIVMGDLVLFEDEVNPVMSTLLKHHLDVTALHNHFFFDQPKVYFMHIGGVGAIQALSKGIQQAMETIKQVRTKFPNISNGFDGSISKDNRPHSITSNQLESIFKIPGQVKNGMVKFVIGRKIKMHGIELGKEMGINTWAAFGGNDENAIVDGDFAVTEGELQQVLRVLRDGNINIVAIHNHMTMEKPRINFLHFWGMGRAEELARTIKKALPQEIDNANP